MSRPIATINYTNKSGQEKQRDAGTIRELERLKEILQSKGYLYYVCMRQ